MSHFIEETKREISMARCHNRRIPVYLKRMMYKILFRNQKGSL
jgi:hypothetical protein